MRLRPLPGRREDAWHDEIDAALHGADGAAAGESWRELRTDVRALAPPLDAGFQRLLAERVAQWAADSSQRQDERSDARSQPPRSRRRRLRPAPLRTAGLLARRLRMARLRTAGLLAGTLCAIAIGTVIVVSQQPSKHVQDSGRGGPLAPSAQPLKETRAHRAQLEGGEQSSAAGASASSSAGAASASASGEGPSAARGRVQQLAAAVSLSSEPEDVQSLADRVARLAVSDGGFVQSSQVAQQARGASEATLDLRVPSAKLATVLASLGRLAPVRAENQSSQDITSEYDAARRNVSDAVAARRALLRALSSAVTQGQIESLRRQISLAAGAIDKAQAALRAVSRQASSSALEVTVIGNAHARGSTLSRGLHDAGRVLTVALIVLLVGAAIVVPLAAVCLGSLAAGRAWRRHLRERALT